MDPEPREALVLDLPMPFSGARDDFTELLVEDLSQHPFANLPVSLTLTVEDDELVLRGFLNGSECRLSKPDRSVPR